MKQIERPAVYEDEINLYDYWKIIVKRKWLIVGILLISIVISGIITLRIPKIYKVITVLEIGKTSSFLEDSKELKIKIDTVYPFRSVFRLNIPEEETPNIKTEIRNNSILIDIIAESSKPEFAVKVLEDINKQIVEEHGSLIGNFKIDIKNKIKIIDLNLNIFKKEKEAVYSKIKINKKNKAELQEQIQTIDSRTNKLREEMSRLKLQANPGEAMPLLLLTNEVQLSYRYRNELQDRLNIFLPKEELLRPIELEKIEKSIKDTEREKELLQNQINAIRETKVLKPPSYSKSPIKPNIKKNITLAGIVGLFSGIFLVFFVEYVERIRKKSGE